MNSKKNLYKLSLDDWGDVVPISDDVFVLKGNVNVSSGFAVFNRESGKTIPAGGFINVGNAKLEGGQPVNDFASFQNWVQSGESKNAAKYEIIEAKPGSEKLPFVSAKGRRGYEGPLSSYLGKLKLFQGDDKESLLKDLGKMAYVREYFVNAAEKSGASNTKALISAIDGTLNAHIKNTLKNKLLVNAIFTNQDVIFPEDEVDIETEEDENQVKAERQVKNELTEGNFHISSLAKLARRVVGNFVRINLDAADELLIDLKEQLRKVSNEEEKSELERQIVEVESLSPETHKSRLAQHLGFSSEDMNAVLADYTQLVENIGVRAFDDFGKISKAFRKKLSLSEVHEHIFFNKLYFDYIKDGLDEAEAARKANEMSTAIKRFSSEGPLASSFYVNNYAKTAEPRARYAIRTSKTTFERVDAERFKLLSEPLVEGFSISEIISHEQELERKRLGKLAVAELLKRRKTKYDSVLQRVILETTIENLSEHVNQKRVGRFPPIRREEVGDDFLDALDKYYDMEPRVWAFCAAHKVDQLGRGKVEQNANALIFMQDMRLVEQGLSSERDMMMAAKNISTLGWDGNFIHESLYDVIYQNLDSSRQTIANSISDDSLRHRYIAAQFGKLPSLFKLPFGHAIDAGVQSVYGLSRNSIVPLPEQQAREIRDVIHKVKSETEDELYKAAYDYGEMFTRPLLSRTNTNYEMNKFLGKLTYVSKENKAALKSFLKASLKKSSPRGAEEESAKIGYYAEAAVYTVVASKFIPENGSVKFTQQENGIKSIVISDAEGNAKYELIDHGNFAGLCDMAILALDEIGKPKGLVSSELKVYDGMTAPDATFNELAGVAKLTKYVKEKYGIESVPFAGGQQINVLDKGTRKEITNGSGNVIVSGENQGSVQTEGS